MNIFQDLNQQVVLIHTFSAYDEATNTVVKSWVKNLPGIRINNDAYLLEYKIS